MPTRRTVVSAIALSASFGAFHPPRALAAFSKAVDNNIDSTLNRLYAKAPLAKELSTRAKGILVFPRITKAGLLFGGAYGEGVLRKNGTDVAAYNSVAIS